MENLPSVLTPDLGLLFWMFLAFLVVFLILAKWGFPAIVNMVEERKAFIDESLKNARAANEKLAGIQAESEQILRDASQQQAQILKEAMETRDNIVGEAQHKAEIEAAKVLEDAKAKIEVEKQAALAEIRQQVATLSVQIAEKVLLQQLSSDAAQQQLIDRLLDEAEK